MLPVSVSGYSTVWFLTLGPVYKRKMKFLTSLLMSDCVNFLQTI